MPIYVLKMLMVMKEAEKSKKTDRLGIRIILGILGYGVLIVALFWLAGRLDWIPGWLYVGIMTCGQSISAIYLWHKSPELLKLRARIGKGTKKWDKIILGLFGAAYIATIIVAALDSGRFQWSRMPVWLWSIGAAMYTFFIMVTTWAMAINPFFEKTVRIQSDRGHRVIDSGPYRIVRHPGYTAIIIGFIFSTPFLLGSWWAFAPALLAAFSLIVRTALEDLTLQKELAGYDNYARRIRYRLVPGIW